MNIPKNEKDGIVNNQKECWSFQFDKILHNVPQDEVFDYCVSDIIKTSVKGYNGTVFAYGQTGSGKTFTISGSSSNFIYRGIIPRAISKLFQEISTKPEYDFKIQVSYLEIYNEVMFDLLPEHGHSFGQPREDIVFQEDAKGNVTVKGLTRHTVTNEEECFNLLFEGESNRTVAEHKLNTESTRSHCLFTIHLEMKSRIESTEKIMVSKLNFVDLAGSERVKKSGSTGITLKEANYINKSLTFLEQVVVALTEKKGKGKDHVPYRQSKLTHILKDSIGGNCKTVMVATIWPEAQHIQETLSTLNFAKRMKSVVNEMTVNIQLDVEATLRKMQKEIKELKQELAMKNTLADRGGISYEPYTPEEQQVQQNLAKQFLLGESEEIEFDSVRQAKELFYQIRYLYQKMKTIGANKLSQQIQAQQQQQQQQQQGSTTIKAEGGDIKKDDKDKTKEKEKAKEEIQQELEEQKEKEGEDEELPQEDALEKDEYQLMLEKFPPGVIPDKNSAFVIYKGESDFSKDIENQMKQNFNDLKAKKTEAKDLLEKGNVLKDKLKEIKTLLNDKKQNKLNLADEMTNVIDDEECKLIDELKQVRNEYKDVVDNFNAAKLEISKLKNDMNNMKIEYVENFEEWFYKKYGLRIEEHELRLAKAKYGVNADDEKIEEKPYDPNEEAYMNAKRKVQSIRKAKKMKKMV